MKSLIYPALLGSFFVVSFSRADAPVAVTLPAAEHICIIDGATVRSIEDVYFDFARQLGFPPYFGRNLDALFDSLSDAPGPLRIVLKSSDELRNTLGAKKYRQLVSVLLQVQSMRKDVRVIFP